MITKHLLDRNKIFTKELDPTKTTSQKHIEYEQNSKGSYIVDQNTDLEKKRRLISLYTTHTTQKDFIDVVDVEFVEFVDAVIEIPAVDDTSLEDARAKNNTLNTLNAKLRNQIAQLSANIKNYPVVVNQVIAAPAVDTEQQVTDTMSVGSTLYSDRTGAPGAPGGSIQNMLLSKNRKSRLVIQGDGNLVIITGEFDKQGNSLGPEEVVLAFGYDNGETAPSFFTLAWEGNQKVNSYIAVGGLFPQYQHRWRTPGFKTSLQTKLVLDDFGNINLFDKDKLVWSSYGISVADYVVNYTRPTTVNPSTTASATAPPPLPEAASTPAPPPLPVGVYFATLKQSSKFKTKLTNREVTIPAFAGQEKLTINSDGNVEFKVNRFFVSGLIGDTTVIGKYVPANWDLQRKIS